MLRIISLIILLLSSFRFHKTSSILSYLLYTISLFRNDIYIKYNWFDINNISFDFEIYFGIIETLICSIICLILIILHYSADILYKSDKYINNKLRLLNFFAFSMCIAICSKNMWQFYISIELLGLISSIFVAIEFKTHKNESNINKHFLNKSLYNNVKIVLNNNYCYMNNNNIPYAMQIYTNTDNKINRLIYNTYEPSKYNINVNANTLFYRKISKILLNNTLIYNIYKKNKNNVNNNKILNYKQMYNRYEQNQYKTNINFNENNNLNGTIYNQNKILFYNNTSNKLVKQYINSFSSILKYTKLRDRINNNQYKISIIEKDKVETNKHNHISIIHDATLVYAYNKFASIIFLIGTILYLIDNKCNVLSVICFTIACLCKSAQMPFASWLIKATIANTLASILIHCATIIGVGIIFINKFYFIFEQYQFIMNTILIISLCTSIIYPIIALYENNIKKIMAYLTISSTGTMFSLCALKHYSISINYFLCHAFFKSLLFLIFAYYIEYFKTKNIVKFNNIKGINTVGLIAVLSSIGIPPFIGCIPKFIMCDALYNDLLLVNIVMELSNCLMDIVIFKLYLQYLKSNRNTISIKFNIKQVYLLIILSIIYGFVFIIVFKYNVNNVYISILENTVVILLSYIIACNTNNIPFNNKQTKLISNKIFYNIKYNKLPQYLEYSIKRFYILCKVIHYSNILKIINDFTSKIEKFYKNIIYNYHYRLAKDIENTNNSNYNNQVKYLVIGIVVICIILCF